MEITQENFEAQFPLITESINSADFIAIDSEFSGITSLFLGIVDWITCILGHSASFDDKAHDYDTVEERY